MNYSRIPKQEMDAAAHIARSRKIIIGLLGLCVLVGIWFGVMIVTVQYAYVG